MQNSWKHKNAINISTTHDLKLVTKFKISSKKWWHNNNNDGSREKN